MEEQLVVFAALVMVGLAVLFSAVMIGIARRVERGRSEVRHASYQLALAAPGLAERVERMARSLEDGQTTVRAMVAGLVTVDRLFDRAERGLRDARASIWGFRLAALDAIRWLRTLQLLRDVIGTVRFFG